MTSAIVFDHRGRTEKGRPGPLEVRITNERKVYYVSTGIKVLKSEWKHGEVVNRPDSDEIMEQLAVIERAIVSEVTDRLRTNQALDIVGIRRAVWGCRETGATDTSFLDWYEENYKMLPVSSGTRAHYKTVLARLRTCAIINRWEDVTVDNVLKFDTFARGLRRPATDAEKKMGIMPPHIEDCVVYNYHKCLKSMLNRAVSCGKLQSNPYGRLRGKFRRGDKETVSYLTEEEVAAFCSLMPVPGSVMAAARDLFVFQLYTGLAYGDTQRFDINEYKKVDGRWVNIGTRVKTGVPYVSSLLPPAVEVLERYNMQLPKLDNKTYNDSLKALGAAAGITTPLHSHMARHTFATWMLKNGVKIENVSRMLGHTNIKQTERYAKVLAESVHEDFARMEALINGNKYQ